MPLLFCSPLVRGASRRLAGARSRFPRWLGPVCAQALVGRRGQAVWALALGAIPVLVLVAHERLWTQAGLGGLTILAIVAASWLLRCSLLLPVLAVTIGAEVACVAMGDMDAPAGLMRILTLASVAAASRLGLVGWTQMRDSRQHVMSTLLRASHAMGSSVDLDRVAAEAVRAAAGTVSRPGLAGGRSAALLRVTGEAATLVAACDPTGVELQRSGEVALGRPTAALWEPLDTGRTAVVTADGVPGPLRELTGTGVSAWAAAKVQVAGEPFGLLAVASPHPSEFRREDLRLLDGIARVAGLAIATALRHAELDELKRRLQHGVALALDAGRSLEPADVVAATLIRVADSVAADRATLARLDGGNLVVESTYWVGGGGQLVALDRRFPPDSVEAMPALARSLASGQPVVGGPLEAGAGGRELAGALADGRHTMLFPFVVAGRTTCVLVLARHRDEPFGEADLARLEPMADVALLALRNAHLYAEAERARLEARTLSGRLQLAIDAAADIGSGLELSEVLDRTLRRAVEVARADRGSISRLDAGRMVVECNHDPSGPPLLPSGTVWTLADSPLAGEAVRAGRPIRGGRSDLVPPSWREWGEEAKVNHLVACPLMVGREVVGLLSLSRRELAFDEADLLTLQPFATLAGLLLRNARLLAEARQVGRAKSAFLNLAAHELRTPLSVIKGYLSMLEDGTYPIPDDTREGAVSTLVAKAQELESLVESLLASARLEVGRLPRTPVELDVRDAVGHAVDRIGARARLEGAVVHVSVPDHELPVRADRDHVARILDNLLNNALTYSDAPADVRVTVRCRDELEVVVEDRGLGIPAEQHDQVFERFHRLEGEGSRFTPGLGLGLSISRELAHVNEGSLVLERSVPGRGSTFVLRLPLLVPVQMGSATA